MTKTIQNGGFTNPAGGLLTGNLLLVLSQDAKVAAAPNQVAPIATRIPISAGNIAPTLIYFNDELLPNNTYYTATAYDAAGNKTYGPEIVSLTGAGPLDLGTLVPLLISPDPLFSNPVLQGPAAAQTITGQALILTATAPLTVGSCRSFANVQCVDSTLSRGGIDIGDEINKAYAALPANGGDIWIFPSTTNSAYSFTTPIVLATANKIVRLRGHSPSTPTPTQGLTLNYTPVTATAAITLDYDNGASGGGQNSHIAVEGITLMNNGCITLGGCGSSATGIAIGNTNGAQSAVFKDMRVSGFGTGISNPNNNSWGQTLENVGFTYNTTALNYVSAENTTLVGCKFVANGTAITTVGGELTMLGGSLDSSVTAGFVCTGAAGQQINYLIGVHMENQNGQATGGANLSSHFFTGTCNMTILGGAMENDNRSAGGTSDWLLNSSGGALVVEGTEFSSVFSGALTTGFLNLVSPVRAKVSFIDSSPAVANPSCGGTGCAAANINRIVQGTNNNPVLWQLGDTALLAPIGIGDAQFFPSTAVGLHLRVNANNLDALRMEDYQNTHTVDIGPAIGGATLFAIRDITNAKQILQYSFSTGVVSLQNASGLFPAGLVIASGTSVMGTAAIAATTCATAVTTAGAGIATTDAIIWAFNAAPPSGYAGASPAAGLGILAYVTSGNVNFQVCNPTAASITPAVATLNWRVVR